MLYRWLTHLFRAGLMFTLTGSLVAIPAVYANKSDDSDNTEMLVAELAEDESVEDVEHSEPLRSSEPKKNSGKADTTQKSDEELASQDKTPDSTAEPAVEEVAPNVDLKEVAPPPKPAEPAESKTSEPEPSKPDATADQPNPLPRAQTPQRRPMKTAWKSLLR